MSDTGNAYDPDQPVGVLGDTALPPQWLVGDSSQPSILGPAFNPQPWTLADSTIHGLLDPKDFATVDFGDMEKQDQPQPPQPDASGFTGLTPWQPDTAQPDAAQPDADYTVGPVDTPPFQYPDRIQTDQALSDDPRVQAFLTTLRGQEGQRYNAVVGGGSFDDYSQHPGTGTGNSHAAGAYQFQPGTWEPIQKALNLPDFSPDSQDLAAVDKLRSLGATDKLLSDDLDGAIHAASGTWMGMPATGETMTDSKGRTRGMDANGNATFTLDQTRASYQKNLGPQ